MDTSIVQEVVCFLKEVQFALKILVTATCKEQGNLPGLLILPVVLLMFVQRLVNVILQTLHSSFKSFILPLSFFDLKMIKMNSITRV
jgi:hypothetical protein